MKAFLNSFTASNRKLQKYPPELMAKVFVDALNFITTAVGKRPFRPVRSLNAAVFDSVMTIVSQNVEALKEKGSQSFAEKYDALTKDPAFRRLVTQSTADDQSVKDRFAMAEKYLLS